MLFSSKSAQVGYKNFEIKETMLERKYKFKYKKEGD